MFLVKSEGCPGDVFLHLLGVPLASPQKLSLKLRRLPLLEFSGLEEANLIDFLPPLSLLPSFLPVP